MIIFMKFQNVSHNTHDNIHERYLQADEYFCESDDKIELC